MTEMWSLALPAQLGDEERLLTVIPLLCTTLSVVMLAMQRLHRNEASRRFQRDESLSKDEATLPQRSAKSWLNDTLFEATMVAYGLALVLSSCNFMNAGSLNLPACVGLISWNYLLALLVIRSSNAPKNSRLNRSIWTHGLMLYGLHWLITVIIYFKNTTNHDSPSWTSPLSQGLLVTSLLLGWKLCEPTILIATRPGKDGKSLVQITASLMQLVTFSWLDPLIWTGFCKRLEADDVWGLTESNMCSVVLERFRRYRAFSQRSLAWGLAYGLRRHLTAQCFWAVVASLTSYMPTFAMQSILSHIEATEVQSSSHRIWLDLVIMLASGAVYAIADGQTVWLGELIRIRLRDIIVGEVYRKIMKRAASCPTNSPESDHSGRRRTDDGIITSLTSSDSNKIADAGASAYEILATVPIRVATTLYLLYQLLGPSSLAGITMMLAITPLNSLIFKYMGKAVMDTMSATDARVQKTDRLLRNVRMIKLFAWEGLFRDRLLNERSKELVALQSRLNWWAIMATIWYVVPSFITFAAFFTFTAVQRQPLPPSTAFTALSLFGLLKAPLDQLIGMSAKIQESLLSLRRVEAFLNESETGKYDQVTLETDDPAGQGELYGFKNATLAWEGVRSGPSSAHPTTSFTLRDIHLSFSPKSLNVVAGRTGCGKTSLLLGLLGEMTLQRGTISGFEHEVSYCAQEAWLINDTIKSNILFGAAWDTKRYEATIGACALIPDIATFEYGDMTNVGEKGAALSGGQKQRVALARAIYAHTSHVLLDDCLSALDSRTAKLLVENCITGPLMEGRTCVIATHLVKLLLPYATSITILSKGTIATSGSPAQLKDSPALLALLDSYATKGNEQNSHTQSMPEADKLHPDPAESDTVDIDNTKDGRTAGRESKLTVPRADKLEAKPLSSRLSQRPPGHIPIATIRAYLKAMGGWLFWMVIIMLFAAQQLISIALTWWLREFANAYSDSVDTTEGAGSATQATSQLNTASPNTWFYLSVYATILALYSIVSFGRLYVASMGSVSASKVMHRQLLTAILQAKFQFFDQISHGTLLKCFTQDIQTVDSNVMPMALGTLHFLVMSAFTLALIAMMTPNFLIPGLAMMAIYLVIGRFFLDSSRELERIKSQQQEPLCQHVSESLLGLITIRAFHQESRFEQDHYSRLDTANKPTLYLGAVDRWLAFRLNLTGTLMSFVAGLLALVNIGKISPGAIGLMLTYTMTFSENIVWMVRYHALNQQNFSSVERIEDFSRVEPEAPEKIPSQPPKDWPSRGVISFKQYSTRHHETLPEVLKGLNFEVRSRERIGIVGRTGAGKTSLAMSILRALEATAGSIEIDGIDIGAIGLHDLRRAVCLVPQDPFLFAGTLRDNLDPYSKFTDEHVREALRDVGLLIRERNGPGSEERPQHRDEKEHNAFADIAMAIDESGANVSLGQRQLICLARALLQSTKVVILDEATASMDPETDQMIQTCVSKLRATVITIAHRLTSILDYDKVLVMDNGEVQQFGHSWELLQKEGPFRKLCEDNGDMEELEAAAKKAWNDTKRERSTRGAM
ncbi:hypothetical protein MBLNU459_g7281t1 [Dothideomycetes sp. NU459]